MSDLKFTLQLTSGEALVLYGFLRRHDQDGEVEIRHSAEDRVLRRLPGQLNGRLADPLGSDYTEKLQNARHTLA